MRVVIDGRCLAARRGAPLDGAGRYVLHLVPAILDLDQSNEYVIWVSGEDAGASPLVPAVRGRAELYAPGIPFAGLSQHWRVGRELAKQRADLYHYCGSDVPFSGACGMIATVHDANPLAWAGYFARFDSVKRAWFRSLVGRLLRRGGQVISSSESARRDLVELFPRRERQLHAVPLGIEPQDFQPDESRDEIRRELDLGAEPFVLYLGNNRPHKNLARVIRAFVRLRRGERLPHKLVLAGLMYDRYPQPAEIAGAAAGAEAVRVVGPVSNEQTVGLYGAAEALVYCSLSEGFGLPILEAMAAGLPVVTSGTGAMAEVADQAAELVDPWDEADIERGLYRVLSDESYRKELQRRGWRRVGDFPWRNTARGTLEVYHSAVRER